jgi:branched-chain amino acid transport system permease protein
VATTDTPSLVFFLALLIEGALAGAVYALIALAFVLVYKASRMINFAAGEWVMLGALLAGTGVQAIGLGLVGATLFACIGMAAFGLAFNAAVVRRLVTRPAITLIMVTLGLGALMRGGATLAFAGIPTAIAFQIPLDPIMLCGVPVAPDKLAAAAIAGLCVVIFIWFYQRTRTGIALRAICDDQQAALAAGIDVHRHFALIWALTGVISAIAGVLWSLIGGGGFSVALVGLKVFPIVIIGGLDSISGVIVGAMIIGVIESLGAGYVDPTLGAGFGTVTSYLLLIGMLLVRPQGLFGRPRAVRV